MNKSLFKKAVILTSLAATISILSLSSTVRATIYENCAISYKNYSTYSFPLNKEDIAIAQTSEKNSYKEDIVPSHLSVLGFTLEKNSFKDVQDKLGVAEFYKNKIDGESADDELYYMSNVKGDDTVVEFASGPSGGWKYLDGFIITTLKNLPEGQIKPTPSSLVNRDISTQSGLRLGISQKEFEEIIGGNPSFKKEDALYYSFHKTKMKDNELFDVDSFVVAKFKDGKLVFLLITKTEFS
jgi:hypothetical protein